MTKHTPGPWYATGAHVQSAAVNEDNYICEAEGTTPEEAQANAALIAAAPALLEALKMVYASSVFDSLNEEKQEQIENAIAKAEGR